MGKCPLVWRRVVVQKKNLIIIVAVLTALMVFIAAGILKKKDRLPLMTRSGSAVSVSQLAAEAKQLEAQGSFEEAKAIYQDLINNYPNSSEVMNWQKKTEGLNMKLLFSPVLTAKSILYQVESADTLTKIAKDFKTTTELIMKSNNLASDKIFPGKKIKIWTAPFSILVYKSQNLLFLKTDEEIIKTYVVSTGKNNSTPVGAFKITSKLLNPTWFKAGAVVPASSPDNILGTRWMGFDLAGYGIHGTTEPQNLGKQVTQGCVRMSNQDVEELYTIIPLGTEVTIVE